MARVEPKGRPRRDRERQPIEMVKRFDSIELRNSSSGAVVTLPKDATPAEIAKARKQLRPDEVSIYNENAKSVVEKMYSDGKPAPTGDSDPEPMRPVAGVGNPNSPYRLKQEAEWQAWKARQNAHIQRQQKLDDDRRLADLVAERIGQNQQAEPAEPSADDLAKYLPPELNLSWEQFKAKAEASAPKPEGGGDAA